MADAKKVEVRPPPIDELLIRIRKCMNRWAARYAEAPHAKEHVRETRLLMQEIDEELLRR